MPRRRNSGAGSSSTQAYKAPNGAFYTTYPPFHPVNGYLRRLPESYQHVQEYHAFIADKKKKKPFALSDYTAEGDYNADKVPLLPPLLLLPPARCCCRYHSTAAAAAAAVRVLLLLRPPT